MIDFLCLTAASCLWGVFCLLFHLVLIWTTGWYEWMTGWICWYFWSTIALCVLCFAAFVISVSYLFTNVISWLLFALGTWFLLQFMDLRFDFIFWNSWSVSFLWTFQQLQFRYKAFTVKNHTFFSTANGNWLFEFSGCAGCSETAMFCSVLLESSGSPKIMLSVIFSGWASTISYDHVMRSYYVSYSILWWWKSLGMRQDNDLLPLVTIFRQHADVTFYLEHRITSQKICDIPVENF